jgi:hypothetical protein
MAVDGEARDPPDSVVIVGEHSGESLIALDARKRRTGSFPCPSGGLLTGVRDEPRRHHRTRDLLVQRVAIVRRRRDAADFAAPERRKSWHQHHEGSSPR